MSGDSFTAAVLQAAKEASKEAAKEASKEASKSVEGSFSMRLYVSPGMQVKEELEEDVSSINKDAPQEAISDGKKRDVKWQAGEKTDIEKNGFLLDAELGDVTNISAW